MRRTGIAPVMDSNKALRMILWCLQTLLGMDEGGSVGMIPGRNLKVTRAAASGPSPTPALQLVPANEERRGGVLRNLDANLTGYYGSDEGVTDTDGATLKAGESVPLALTSAIYIYAPNGHPIFEFAEVTA